MKALRVNLQSYEGPPGKFTYDANEFKPGTQDTTLEQYFQFIGDLEGDEPVKLPHGLKDAHCVFADIEDFNREVIIPDTVENCCGMFYRCRQFNKPVNIPDSVKFINGMFEGCYKFNQNVEIPTSATECEYMFKDCKRLNSEIIMYHYDDIREGVNADCMFSGCESFEGNVQLSPNITDMSCGFKHCTSLCKPIILPKNLESATLLFDGCSNYDQTIEIPPSVKDIGGITRGIKNPQCKVTMDVLTYNNLWNR